MKKTKYMFSIYAGATPDSKNPVFWDGDIVWITPADFKTTDKYVLRGSKSLTEAGYRASNTTIVPAGSIIISKRAPIGTVSIAGVPLCTNQGCLSCVPKDDVDSTFAYYALSAMNEKMQLLGAGTTFMEISANSFANMKVPYFTLPEQKAIVRFLDQKCSAIDEAIERHKKIIEKLEEYKSEIITAHLLGLNHEDMKDSQIEWMGRIASNRQLWRLKFLLSTSLKYGANESGCAYDEQLPRYIRITDIDTSGKLKETGKQSLTEQQAKDYLLTDGTVLFARSGATVGKTFLYKESFGRAAFAGYLISAVPNKELILPEWLKYYTESIPYKNWKDSIFTQATIQNIGADKYSNLVIPLCSIAEQQMIVGRLNIAMNKINDVVEKHNRVIAKLEEYRKSIIYNAVTGKIDCRTEATG